MSHHANNYYTNKTKPYTVTAGDLDTTINYVNTQAAAVRSPSLGGTGISSYVAGDILYASGTTTLAKVSIGDAGTFLTSDGSAPSWDFLDRMSFTAKADVDIEKGEVVYITGISGNTPTVDLARANNASTMPAFGLAAANVTATNTVEIVTFGSLRGLTNTDFREGSITFTIGDTVYVSSATAGKLTNVAPTGEANLIQNIGRIERASPTSNMTVKVGGAGRSAATPALDDGNIFIGNASNQSSTASLTTKIEDYLDGGTSTPTFSTVNINTTGTSEILSLTSTDDGTNAAPVIDLVRDSSSPASADYLGQIKFKGENSSSGSVVYSKITGKIDTETASAEDGIIEFAVQRAGSSTIVGRLKHDKLLLANSTDLEVSGDAQIDGSLTLATSTAVSSIIDDDSMATASATALATSESIKAYVDAQIDTADQLSELSDTTFTSLANGDLLQYGGSGWINSTSFPGQYAFTNSSGTTLDITNGTGYEIDFTGATTTNIRSERDMHLLAQAGYGINLGSNNTSGVLIVASDGGVDTSGALNVGGKLNVGSSGTNLVSSITSSTGTISTANTVMSDTIAYNVTSSYGSSSNEYTVLAGVTNRLRVIKDSITITVDLVTNALTDGGFPVVAPTVGFRLMVSNNDGASFYSVDTGSYSATAGQGATNAVETLTWSIPSDGLYAQDDFGDDFQLRVDAYLSDADGADGGNIQFSYDISNGAAYNEFPAILSADQISTLRSI